MTCFSKLIITHVNGGVQMRSLWNLDHDRRLSHRTGCSHQCSQQACVSISIQKKVHCQQTLPRPG